MGDAHRGYERLVVGHVLDELVAPDDARFRAHLMRCPDCRARVAELRAIAADLAEVEATAREQVEAQGQATGLAARGGELLDAAERRVTIRYVTLAVLGVLLLATAMGFWNLHLRSSAATYLTVAEARGETLAGLANGTALEMTLSGAATGIAAYEATDVSFVLAGFVPLDHDEQLIGWWLDGAEAVGPPVRLAGPTPAASSSSPSIAATLADPGATTLVVTRERGLPGQLPAGAQIARIVLEDVPDSGERP